MNRNKIIKTAVSTGVVVLFLSSCGITYNAKRQANAGLSLPRTTEVETARFEQDTAYKKNYFEVDADDSTKIYLMEKDRDEQGNEIAKIDIEKVTVTASTKTVAERLGEIVVDFNVSIPRTLQDSRWSINFLPIADDNLGNRQVLEPIVLKGELFDEIQKRSIWQVDRYLNKILDEQGETQSNTVLMAKYFEAMNKQTSERRRNAIERTFNETIKFPLITESRLDSVIRTKSDIKYYYKQVIKPTSGMRRINLYFNSNIQAINGQTYLLPASDTLEYIISSMLSLVDTNKVYRKKVISKYVVVNDRNQLGVRVNVVFRQGRSDVIDTMADNAQQIRNIRSLMDSLVYHDEFYVDTIVLTAAASPEGAAKLNDKLSERRSYALRDYLINQFGRSGTDLKDILTCRWVGEDWNEYIYQLNNDPQMSQSPNRRAMIETIQDGMDDPDKLEQTLRAKFPTEYKYFVDNLYPGMRSVNFKYDLRRKNMTQDTIVTDVLDVDYMRGVEYLKNREYGKALELLTPYENHNTALVNMSLGYNQVAYDLLRRMRYRSPQGDYLLAICCSRLGKLKEGVEWYNSAAERDQILMFRANLDPEIQDLINEAKRRKMPIKLRENE